MKKQTKIYSDGSKYFGQMKNGKGHGQGTYTYANGDKYVGRWKNSKKNGKMALLLIKNGRKGHVCTVLVNMPVRSNRIKRLM